jgi:signal transduction histidine kinase
MEQLARRHDLEDERSLLSSEMNRRYARQKTLLHWLSGFAALLVVGIGFTILIGRILRLRQVARIKERLAADLHDELGANIHTIALLSDLAEDAWEEHDVLSQLLQNIRSMTERSGIAVRHFGDLLKAEGLYTELVADIRKTSERVLANLDQDLSIEGAEHIKRLKPSTCFDVLLFYKECLVNISRHSDATRFNTHLSVTDKELQLTVSDNGCGLENIGSRIPDSLQRRARLLGATFSVETPATGGTRIRLKLRTRRWGRRK